jgi:hypothetical protein
MQINATKQNETSYAKKMERFFKQMPSKDRIPGRGQKSCNINGVVSGQKLIYNNSVRQVDMT